MTATTIFGTGNMGTAIGDLFASRGNSVQHIGKSDSLASIEGDIVVLAVPYPSLKEITAKYAEQLEGKIVVDITNPIDFATFDSLTVPAGSSAAAELAAALPKSHVLKAFNTTIGPTIAAKTIGTIQTTVLIAGDDPDAKSTLSALITGSGIGAIDAGTLRRARELEAFGFLQLALAVTEKISWTGGFGIVR
jgi:8-hydroxy-5-deazaflavin:NADPH oxidoreductase